MMDYFTPVPDQYLDAARTDNAYGNTVDSASGTASTIGGLRTPMSGMQTPMGMVFAVVLSCLSRDI